MRRKYSFLIVISLYCIIILVYILFFLFHIESIPLFLFLTIGSVAVLSTSTIYTVMQSKGIQDKQIREKKYFAKPKAIKTNNIGIIEDYIDTMPSIKEYIESDESYKDIEIINKYIFTLFSLEELEKINLLRLSKIDKILFIREMIYFKASERKKLIENMLYKKDRADEEIIYTPPINSIEMEDQIRVYVRSLVNPGEKTKIIIIDITESISVVKERIGKFFDYALEDFLLSSGGILLDENSQIKDYDIDDDDEIALIPSRKEKD
ncbi:MAG: ubiquitin-like protein [Promethearchaeota archaeon]